MTDGNQKELKQEEQAQPKKSAFAIFMEEITSGSLLIPLLAIFSGLLLGGLIVMLTTEEMYQAFGQVGSVVPGLDQEIAPFLLSLPVDGINGPVRCGVRTIMTSHDDLPVLFYINKSQTECIRMSGEIQCIGCINNHKFSHRYIHRCWLYR